MFGTLTNLVITIPFRTLVIRIDVLIVHTVSILLYHLSSSLVGNLQLEIGK